MPETDHEAADRRGDLHNALCALVEKHGAADVEWMLSVIIDDLTEARPAPFALPGESAAQLAEVAR